MSTTRYRNKKRRIINLIKAGEFEGALEQLIPLIETHPGDYELHYFLGMIHGARFRYVEALKSFNQALKLNPRHVHSYLEIGIVHATLCRYNMAFGYFKKARFLDPHLKEAHYYIQEIKKVARPKDVTLSACLIVRNEERHLRNCLRSIQAVADEIIVVDTGSEDKSADIAESFGARVYDYAWQSDFAAARNYAIEQATGEWILQIDADEELFPEDQYKVREVIHQGQCDGAFVALQNRNTALFGENQPTVHYLVRLYRNREDIRYVGPIHETLEIPGEVLPTDINFLHHGYNLDPDYLRKKRKRNAEILYRRYQEDPNNITTLFYLSMMHLGNQEFELSEAFAKQVVEKLGPQNLAKQHVYLMSLNNLALISVERGDYEQTRAYCQEAIRLNDNYLDPYFFLGLAYFREEAYSEAKVVFTDYVKKHEEISKKPVFNLFSQSSGTYLFQVCHLLGKIYRKERKYREAEQMMRRAIELNPSFWVGYADLGYLQMDLHQWDQAANYLDQAIAIARNSPAVNRSNELLWFDFMNVVKNYIIVLKRVTQRNKRRSRSNSLSTVLLPETNKRCNL